MLNRISLVEGCPAVQQDLQQRLPIAIGKSKIEILQLVTKNKTHQTRRVSLKGR